MGLGFFAVVVDDDDLEAIVPGIDPQRVDAGAQEPRVVTEGHDDADRGVPLDPAPDPVGTGERTGCDVGILAPAFEGFGEGPAARLVCPGSGLGVTCGG